MPSLSTHQTVLATAGAALLGMGLLTLPLLVRQVQPPEPQVPMLAASTVACKSSSPPVTMKNLTPSSAGTTSEPGKAGVEAHLYATGAIHMLVCRVGVLRLKVRGVSSNGWGAQAVVLVDGHVKQTVTLNGSYTFSVPLAQASLVTLAFVNYSRLVADRYLIVTRDPRGPWCPEKPPYREGGAWLRSGGEYGDITGGGRLNFPTCGAGQVNFKVAGHVTKGSPPQMQVKQDGQVVETRQVTRLSRLTFVLGKASLLTFTVLNPDLEVKYERSIYLDAATVEPR
jgi:hypothetical protein